MTGLTETMRQMSRWRLFAILVGLTAVLAGGTSVLTYKFLLDETNAAPVKIALIRPADAVGAAMEAGARQALAKSKGVIAGHPVQLMAIDEADPNAAATAANDKQVIGVIGPYSQAAAARSRPITAAADLATVSLASATGDADGTFYSIAPSPTQEVRFLANYVRNVLGERLVSIVVQDDPGSAALADEFDAVLQHFGTRVVYRWAIPASGADGLKAVADEMNTKQIAGSILLLGSPSFTAQAVATLRGADVPNRIVGTREMATQAFAQALRRSWTGSSTEGAGLNGTTVTTPMLFDTAGIAAQEFRTALAAAGTPSPDWLSVLTYDATSGLTQAMAELGAVRRDDATALRKALPAALAAYNGSGHALKGLSGPLFFDHGVAPSAPQLVGVYDGSSLISSPIQLTPIREEGVSDYLQELKEGRALYVNDRFMYKTSVVYAGMHLEKVLGIDGDNNIADVEFTVWFRWRGTLEPQSVVFPNAVTPIELTKPERESKNGDLSYRGYRVRGKFFMNYSNEPHPFGTQLIEIVFRHRSLGINNLRYVTDTLGLGLEEAGSVSAEPGFIGRLLGTAPTGALARQMAADRVLTGVPGWLVDRAWLSQDDMASSSRGDPVFVGFGKPAPVFSAVGMGLVAKPDTLDLQDAVPPNWLVYATIFGVFGAVLAYVLDRKERGHLWRLQSLLLRLVTWPLLLMTNTALTLQNFEGTLSPSMMQFLSSTSSALWWLIGAWLLNLIVERLVWVPLELRAERKVPTVFRALVMILIFVLAGFGVVAFVLGRTIASLLATSGVLTFIVGLAIQSNLKDIFSGIMLNMERPFRIGDFLRINRNVGQVVDVSWRTTRVQVGGGAILALPNGRLSDSEIENLSRATEYPLTLLIPVDAAYSPDVVIPALREAMTHVTINHKLKAVGVKEIVRPADEWIVNYEVRVELTKFKDMRNVRHEAYPLIWKALNDAGLRWVGSVDPNREHAPETERVMG